jgi:hypothetical protein
MSSPSSNWIFSTRTGEDARKFVAGEGDGIGLHAAGVHGLLDHLGSVRRREAVVAKARGLEMGDEVLHPGDSVVSSSGLTASEEAGNDFITAEGFAGWLPITERGEVCVHHIRKQRGADGAVGRGGEDAADGTSESMRGAEPGVRQGESAKQTGEGHVFAGAVVTAIVKGGAQRARSAGDAVAAEGVGDGIGARADKRFDELGEGVQPGAGGEVGRQVAGQLRVNHCDARKHERTAKADLETVFGRSEYGVSRDFGAGAGGGGNGDERSGWFCERPAAADDFKMIKNIAAVGKQGGDGLAGVNGAAAAEGDDEVAMFACGEDEAVLNGLDFRFAVCRKDDGIHAMFAQKFKQGAGAKGVASSDDERAAAEFGGERADIVDDARTEDDAIGGGEFEAHIGDGIRGRENPRGHLRLAGGGHFIMAEGAGLRHSRRGL